MFFRFSFFLFKLGQNPFVSRIFITRDKVQNKIPKFNETSFFEVNIFSSSDETIFIKLQAKIKKIFKNINLLN